MYNPFLFAIPEVPIFGREKKAVIRMTRHEAGSKVGAALSGNWALPYER